MRTSILLTIDAKGQAKMLASPAVPIQEQKDQFKDLAVKIKDGQDEVSELQLWNSDAGIVKRRKFMTVAQVKAVAAAQEREAARARAAAQAAKAAEASKATPSPPVTPQPPHISPVKTKK